MGHKHYAEHGGLLTGVPRPVVSPPLCSAPISAPCGFRLLRAVFCAFPNARNNAESTWLVDVNWTRKEIVVDRLG